jgi:GNAT superfamily N-acetyltransferase
MMTIRPARPEEAPVLSTLAKRSKAYWGYDEMFMDACDLELTVSPQEIDENPTYVIECMNQVIGFYALEALDEQRAELNFLFVAPERIGQGYGRRLIEHAKQTVRSMGRSVLVIEGDPNAAPFYEAAGGRRVGSKPSRSIPGRSLPLFQISV